MKSHSYSNVKYTPRVSSILLTVEKIEHDNLDFVLFSSFFYPCITQNMYTINEESAHEITLLLSEIFLLLSRAACESELRLLSYVPTMLCCVFPILHFVCTYRHYSRTTDHIRRSTYWMNVLPLEISLFFIRAICEIQLVSDGFKHALQPLSNTMFCATYTCNSKTTNHIFMFYKLNGFSTIEDVYFLC